ncbi:MAG: NAD(P)-dependent oxidoreductase [Acidimicrobiia bacterium]
MADDRLPVLYFDRPFPDELRDLIDGRALVVGPDEADIALADAVIVGVVRRWDAEAIALGPRLRVISRSGIGYDNIDLDAAEAAGVTVCYAPDAPTVSTAEHTMALLLAITKQVPVQQGRARAGLGTPLMPSALELDGCTLGLVGLGRIARRVAVAARGLGMNVIAVDPLLPASPLAEVMMTTWAELLADSEVVSLHAPALPETVHLVDDRALAAMKPGSYLVNCARGTLVDQDALLQALDHGHLAGAALDVTVPEPLPAGHPLLEHPNVIVTPHVASSTAAGRRRLFAHAIDNAIAVLEGRPASTVPARTA